jgi:uncharacterized protein YfaS (alpha-2-macroglobulin family)
VEEYLMAGKLVQLISRFKILIIAGLAILTTVIGFLVLRNYQNSQPPEQIIPLVIDPSDISSAGLEEPASLGGFMAIRLSEGQPDPPPVEPLPQATGEPLTTEEIEQILARLPELSSEPTDQLEFKLPEDLLPPPRTGETISEVFPPPPEILDKEPITTGPLEVLRFAPEGEIPLAPFVNITFNQPMVPLATLEELAARDVPVRMEPELPGLWQWVGTKTLTFQYDSEAIDRLPMATEYLMTVDAGTTSATGGVLAEDVRWTFSTPPVRIISSFPYDAPQPLEPIFYIAFDQRIEPEAVLSTIVVTAGEEPVSLVIAKPEDIANDTQLKRLADNANEGRWLAFKASEPLPPDTRISVEVGPGTPSAEGPLVTKEIQRFSFKTYAPLEIEDHGCSWSRDRCPPLTPFFIRFNNPIDLEAFDDIELGIDPALPGVSTSIFGDTINIQGATQGQTTYRITVDGDLQDIFGQTLGEDTVLTFRVGQADPLLIGPDKLLVTLDPEAGQPKFSVYTINRNRLEVQIYAVEPEDWPAFKQYIRNFYQTDIQNTPPGRLVKDETLRLEVPADTLTEAGVDLSQVMDGNFGHFIVIVKPPRSLFQDEWEVKNQTVQAWIQVTQIGLDAFSDHSEMVVWTSALRDGSPLSGVTITADSTEVNARTGEDGTVRLKLPGDGASYLVASQGADRALLPRSEYFWGDDYWKTRSVQDELRWYVLDDRQMYRPGEEVHIKGWLREVGGKQDGNVALPGNTINSVSFEVYDPQGNSLVDGVSEVNALGGFDFVFTISENANLGYAQIYLTASGSFANLGGSQYYHGFQIQEFRRPEFEVKARNETVGPYFVGEHAILAVAANYFAGGPLPSAEVIWQVASSPGTYQPPNWPEFVFGTWQPWWYFESYYGDEPYYQDVTYETFNGTTDASGNHFLRLDFDSAEKPQPYSVLAEATVFDVNRQAWVGTTSLLVHPAQLYVGMRSERTFVSQGEPLRIDLIVTDLDGNPVIDRPIQVTAARLEWKQKGYTWQEEEVDLQKCTMGSTLEPVSCSFETPVGGRYLIIASVTDALGHKNQSQVTRWVSGGERPPSRNVEQEEVTLIPDKETYQPGDTAQILVQAPFTPAEGLMTVSRSGILYTERFSIEADSTVLEILIEDSYIPNLNIQVDVVGATPRRDAEGQAIPEAPSRPAFATGQLNLSIPPMERTLSITVVPQEKELEPGGETTLSIDLKNSRGQPVSGAELAVIVVDEAVLALTNYRLSDPLAVFYQNRPADLSSHYLRSSIVLVDPTTLTDAAAAGGDAAAEKAFGAVDEAEGALEAPSAQATQTVQDDRATGPESSPIQVRTDFNPLATFSPEVRTDNQGQAQVPVKLPDNLTRYRVMVVAVDDTNQFGAGETNLVARLPLMVRPSAPRFLNFGDQFELPVVLQNQTDAPLAVEVLVQATNIDLTDDAGRRVMVPARDRVEVRFSATTELPGTARFQIAAVSGSFTDAAGISLPVFTPATTEAFATYGVVDDGAVAQPVASPTDVYPQFGGLEITTSSTALQALTDAVLYLVSYPYECSEQLASRILAVAALRDVLTAFSADGLPSPTEMEAAVKRDIERLQGLQNNDGGFPYWARGKDSIPFNTIHTAHALQMAKIKGFEVPSDLEQSALEYLRQIETHYPPWYSARTRRTLSAYALFVRNLMGDRDPEKAGKLFNEAGVEGHSLEALGWIWSVLLDTPDFTSEVEAIRNHVNNRVVETAGAANFTTYYDDQTYLLLSSDRRTDAILLDALMIDSPQSDLIPKVVNGLLAHRVRGRWYNTQENVFVLLALDRYFNTFEAETPDFVTRIWLGDTYTGSHEFAGRSTERHETKIPMSYLVDESLISGDERDLILSKEGTGRLYYRLGLRYSPTDLFLDPLDVGFVVQRVYEGVDNPEDVYQDEGGIWHIRAGARVRVRLTMVADNRRYHVALVDPLPAGLEIVNPALAVSGSVPQDPGSQDFRYGWWWWGPWYEHQNMRDERAEAFASLLWEGVYEYSYIARATTPGSFVVPPAKAEEMYSPEVFGRSNSDRVIVE